MGCLLMMPEALPTPSGFICRVTIGLACHFYPVSLYDRSSFLGGREGTCRRPLCAMPSACGVGHCTVLSCHSRVPAAPCGFTDDKGSVKTAGDQSLLVSGDRWQVTRDKRQSLLLMVSTSPPGALLTEVTSRLCGCRPREGSPLCLLPL